MATLQEPKDQGAQVAQEPVEVGWAACVVAAACLVVALVAVRVGCAASVEVGAAAVDCAVVVWGAAAVVVCAAAVRVVAVDGLAPPEVVSWAEADSDGCSLWVWSELPWLEVSVCCVCTGAGAG